MPKKSKKNKDKNNTKYIDKLFYRIFLSSLLLLLLMLGCKIKSFKKVIYNNISTQISFTKIAYRFTNIFSSVMDPVGDVTVYNSLIYDSVTYKNEKNYVINYDFEGVINLSDSVVMKIIRKENGLHDVYTVNKDGYTYIYQNLQEVDFNIYSYIESGEIIGRACIDKINNNYKFDLVIEKDGKRFSFYELAED